MKINLLDCTLRDGGYYNNWDFSNELINQYLSAIYEVWIRYVELGFRTLNDNTYRGACAYTTDNFIKSLKVPKKITLGIMINASDILNYEEGYISALKKLLNNKKKSQIKFVRLAAHLYEVDHLDKVCKFIMKLG